MNVTLLFFVVALASANTLLIQEAQQAEVKSLSRVVVDAFRATHDGYSSDEVILNDKLNQNFLQACRQQVPEAASVDCNWELMNLRKAGKLSGIKTTKRAAKVTGEYRMLAEVVSRSLLDRHRKSLDRMMADPITRKEFNALVKSYNADADLYDVRKAAFQLRKTRRLRPELITRIADWGREIKKFTVRDFLSDEKLAPESPGIYIFHDRSGYLYIGQSDNLRTRLKSHLEQSSNLDLEKHLAVASTEPSDQQQVFVEIHAFPKDSRAKEVRVRRAYESELIRSRKPRFNILP